MNVRTVFAWVLVGLLALATWYLIRPVLGWLLATGLLAVVLFPLHRRLEPLVGPRLSAGGLTVAVILVVVLPLVLGLSALVARGTAFADSLMEADVLGQVRTMVESYTGVPLPVEAATRRAGEVVAGSLGDVVPGLVSQGLEASLGLLLFVFVLYYLLKDGRQFVDWVKRMTPLAPAVRDDLFAAGREMVWAVLKGHVFVAIAQGLVAGVSLFVTGVPGAFVLTAAMMVLALIPIVGVAPVMGGAIVYLVVVDQPLSAVFVLLWGLTTVAVTDDYLRAVLIDRGSEMHSAFIFVGLVGGTYLLGVIGLFVGPIIIGLFKTSVETLGDHYGVVDAA